MATIDPEAFFQLRVLKLRTLDLRYQKYLNIDYWLRLNVMRALRLGLHRPHKKPLRILDLGTGFGYFPYVARFYNHDIHGVDLPDDPLFVGAQTFFEIPVTHARIDINAEKILPDLGARYDLITGFQVCFNGHNSDDL